MAIEDETPRLLRALALSQRFHLYLAQCESPRAADRLFDLIATELPKLRGAPVRVVRLQPYAGRTTDAPLTTELNDSVLIPLLAAPDELRAHGTIHVVDASRAMPSDDDAWARLFASWNEKRNRLQQLQGEVVVVLPRPLWLMFATEAPDVWSIRSGEYQIGAPRSQVMVRRDTVLGEGPSGDRIRIGGTPVSAPRDAAVGGAGGTGTATGVGAGLASGEGTGAAAGTGIATAVGAALAAGAGVSAGTSTAAAVSATLAERRGALPAPSSPPVVGPADRPEVAELPAWRLIPPLSLFGGDVVIAAWLPEVLRFHEVRAIHEAPVLAVDADTSVSVSRRLRAAEVALGERQFGRVESLLAGLVDGTAVDAWIRLRIRAALAVTLAAQDQPAAAWGHAEPVQAGVQGLASFPLLLARAPVLGGAAYVAWCSGHLARAVSLDSVVAGDIGSSSAEARLLLAMERGRMAEAGTLAEQLARPLPARKVEARLWSSDPRALSQGMVAADFAFLGDDIADARRTVEAAAARSGDPTGIASGSILARARPFAALLAVVEGDLDGADRVLHGGTPSPAVGDAIPEAAPRQAAFEAYVAGVVATERGDRSAALAGFESARQAIARWAQVGFDRRSLWRAHVATLLSACAVDDDPARTAAFALEAEQRADVLLGDTGEDHIARVLAVLARRARMRNATDLPASRALAHEAAQLAAPLRADGVARWSALADACMREAERGAGFT